jgi:acylphosphatase
MTAQIHVIVSGRVQGVAFRYFAENRANELGLTGWIRNLYDGRVEVLAEGERVGLERLLDLLREGPRMARVEELDVEWREYTGAFPDFRISFSGC